MVEGETNSAFIVVSMLHPTFFSTGAVTIEFKIARSLARWDIGDAAEPLLVGRIGVEDAIGLVGRDGAIVLQSAMHGTKRLTESARRLASFITLAT